MVPSSIKGYFFCLLSVCVSTSKREQQRGKAQNCKCPKLEILSCCYAPMNYHRPEWSRWCNLLSLLLTPHSSYSYSPRCKLPVVCFQSGGRAASYCAACHRLPGPVRLHRPQLQGAGATVRKMHMINVVSQPIGILDPERGSGETIQSDRQWPRATVRVPKTIPSGD